jgi:uncharacterized repeat protein (TIGR01451 family)
MRINSKWLGSIVLALAAAAAALAQTLDQHAVSLARRQNLQHAYDQLPLSFEKNQGQHDPMVEFVSRGTGYNLFLTRGEAVLALKDAALRVKLIGAVKQPQISGLERLPGKANYFTGNDPSKWRTSVPTYRKVRYQGVYPGIELVYYGNQKQLEYDFVVSPAADPAAIAMKFDGADSIEIDAQGDLILHIAGREIREHKPVVYQEIDGAQKLVEGHYALKGQAEVGFSIADYDRTKPLIIDPTLVYSTYLGGGAGNNAAGNSGLGIAIDASGNAYVTGATGSATFPTTAGAFQPNLNTSGVSQGVGAPDDAYVAKLNATGTALVYATYLGGSGQDAGIAITVDSAGSAYVAGQTGSNDFPVTAGAFQTTNSVASGDVTFITKLNATGTALVYSTYLGGSTGANFGIAVDGSGEAFVAGTTSDPFPTTAGAFQTTKTGTFTAFVAKLNAAGNALLYGTYLGGSMNDYGNAMAIDDNGNAYVTGAARSSDFPTTAGAFQTALTGGGNAFVTKLNATGTALIYSTFLGGAGEEGYGIAVDSSLNAYVAGETTSSNFPVTAGAFQTTYGGSQDGFVSKFNATGTALVYSTFLGGSATEQVNAIAVDSAGNAYVTGQTASSNFPTTANGLQSSHSSSFDNVFVTKLNGTGSAAVYSTYMGGNSSFGETGQSIAVDVAGDFYVTGVTDSTNFPVTAGAFQTTQNAANDAFIAKFGPNLLITKTHTGSFSQGQTGATYTITVTNSGLAATSGTITVVDTLPAGLTATALVGTNWTCTLVTLTCTSTTVEQPAASFPPITLTVNVAPNAAASVTNSVSVSGVGDNNTANDPTTINPVLTTPALTITKSHPGSFTQGQTGATYTIAVTDSGTATTSGTVTVVDTLPSGLTATAISGSGWMCILATLTCTTTATEAPGASFPAITLTVTVAANAPASVTNSASVSGGGAAVGSAVNDQTTINAAGSPGATDAFQIRYFANLNVGDSVVDITNSGASGGNLCANVYTFDPAEELISCCTCTVTPNALQSLWVLKSLTANSLTPAVPSAAVIKLLATSGTCNASVIAESDLAPGLLAWGTSLHAQPTTPPSYAVTETPFSIAPLSAAELVHITSTCNSIRSNGSGFGICSGCAAGGLGAITSVQ